MAVVTVEDNIAPEMICQDITIQLDDNGMASITPADVDNGSSDNCADPLMLTLSMEMFTCDNLGAK